MENFQVYHDIQARTGGDIYIGVVGPVRTGKSTFIRRFMELLALPGMDPEKQAEVRDQLPLSGSGKLITTVEPKFIPREAVTVKLGEEQSVRVKLIDCVGFLVKDASGHIEEGKERMVKTPWFENAIPFHEAARIGTGKGDPGTFHHRACGYCRRQFWRDSQRKFSGGGRENSRRTEKAGKAISDPS